MAVDNYSYICHSVLLTEIQRMKKTSILLLTLVVIAIGALAQEKQPGEFRKFSLGFDIYTDIWQKVPDNIDPSWFNRSINVFGLYNNQMGESKFDFSYGLGVSTHNLYMDALPYDKGGYTEFVKLDSDSISYDKAKITLAYVDIPLEIKYRAKSGFRAYFGFKFSVLVHQHSKFVGYDESVGYNVTIKRDDVRYLELWQYTVYGRIGYKWINLYGAYQLQSTFKKDQGPQMFPISVGLSIMPY
ncbi:MAG: outer membrane beta-barrel protein [Bacteroidales bacterium]|jgi:hypothetical protein|nr:outer membrane beta-barrel protein [Bacteroidales bacterium]MDD3665965.1 outer membrane beta-barrel protein [Bacteroidales bacterium]